MNLILKIFLASLLFSVPASAQDNEILPRLKTVGNHLAKPDGTPVTLRGVSLCSLEWHAPLEQINQVMEGEQSWPVDVLRLPVQDREWRRYGAKKYLKDKLDPAIALCKEHNVYCIIDWHEISDWDKPEIIADLENFWKIVAIRYSNDPRIIYEIYNEPTTPKMRNRENWLAWRTQMQKWVNTIRADAPETLLLIGSPHWSQMPNFAAADPLEGENLAYVMHLYPNWKQKQWDGLFGKASETIPIFMTEWGWTSQEDNVGKVIYGTQEGFGEPLRRYLDARPQISWTAWSYDQKCGPAMLGQDKDMANFVKQWLTDAKK